MFKSIKNYLSVIIITTLFIFFSIWWYYLNYIAIDPTELQAELYSATYGIIALLGGIEGLIIAKKWGGFKSTLGKVTLFLSFGLLAQEFGQLAYSYYSLVLGVEIPYPSIGDWGYYGTIPLYIYAVIMLAKTLNIKFTKDLFKKNIIALILPVALLWISYQIFLAGYDYSELNWEATLLAIMYPLGQSIYLAIALLIYILAGKALGGKLRSNVLIILAAFCAQYVADFVFLYTSNRNTWLTAGINEYMYLFAYYIMSLSIIMLSVKFQKIRQSINGK